MFVYLLRRIFNYVVLLFLATSLAYILASISMDPSTLWDRSNPNLNWNAINANLIKYNISHELPVWDRYTTWLQTVLGSWDWGFTPKGESVNALVAVKVGVSLRLVVLGALIGMVGGVSLGAWTATRQYSLSDRTISFIAMVVISTPAMVLATLLQVGAVHLNTATGMQILSFVGEGDGFADRLNHLILPTLSMSLAGVASYSRYQRNLMLDTLGADYVRTARAKGLTRNQAITRHALRVSFIPVAQSIAYQIPLIFAGAFFAESVFAWPGIGKWSIDSISSQDVNAATVTLAYGSALFAVGAIIADIATTIVDPRVRIS